jgi:hypothetical protein
MVYWPIFALALFAAAAHIHDMIRPAWNPVRAAMRIVGYACGLVVLGILYRAQPLVEVNPMPGTSPEELQRALMVAEGITQVSLGVTAVIWIVTIGMEIWRIVQAGRPVGTGPSIAI